MLSLRFLHAGIACAVVGTWLALSGAALAGAKDYRFEAAGSPVKTGKITVLKVRLVHIPDGKAVSGAEIVETKFDMGPAGMAGMTAPTRFAPSAESGIYTIETQPSMAGNWSLTLAAKINGEPDTIRGAITVAVPK